MSDDKAKKKPYEAPRLITYGKITDLTAAKASGADSDGVSNKKT